MALIPLKNRIGVYATVDDDDFERCAKIVWSVDSLGYPYFYRKYRIVRMPRFILRSKAKIDHINRDMLDNRKCNLRFCTNQQNAFNQGARSKTSQYKGVAWFPLRSKWRARIKVNYVSIHLGLFENELDAALAYNRAATKYFKEFAYLNKLPETK